MVKAAWAALAAFAIAPALLAAGPVNPLVKDSVVLKLANLDLTSVEGQRVLAIRMDQAARDVCGDRLANVHLALDAQSRSCQAEVKADIRSRIEQRVADAGRSSRGALQLAMR